MMILCESEKKYPVYTRHTDEVLEVYRRLESLKKRKRRWGEEDDDQYMYYLEMQKKLDILLYELRTTNGDIAYVSKDSRKLVELVANLIKGTRPDKRSS